MATGMRALLDTVVQALPQVRKPVFKYNAAYILKLKNIKYLDQKFLRLPYVRAEVGKNFVYYILVNELS